MREGDGATPAQPARRSDTIQGIMGSVALALLVGGCAISKDAGFGTAPGILIVGTTGPLRTLDAKERKESYRAYLTSESQARPGESPSLGPAEFDERLAGWASISRYRALVPASVAQDARFASAAGSFLFGAKGDLVAARSDRDGLVWIDRVLCKADRTFESCAEKYQPGVFDEDTGRELGRDHKPKANGEWVDVSSYVRLSKDPEHHSASELDVRAINRCDDCKGSLPGSVQSAVRVSPTR